MPQAALARIPVELNFSDAAPLMCVSMTTFNALRHSGANPGDTVAIVGLGGLGHLAVQFASKMQLALNQAAGPYIVMASFAGSANYQSSSTSTSFTITREETTLRYAGDTVIADNTTVHLKAVLLEDGVVPIQGRSVVFTLGSGATGQACTPVPVTDATGTAVCTILVNQPLGPGVVTANFAGDALYLPSSASPNTLVFAFLAQGAFVLGDQTPTVGPGTDTFWADNWSSLNVLSGGSAPDSFKGFTSTVSTNPPVCGDTWTTGSAGCGQDGNACSGPRSDLRSENITSPLRGHSALRLSWRQWRLPARQSKNRTTSQR